MVVIGVRDQSRASALWTETTGFELAEDAPHGAERWLEVRTPDRTTHLLPELNEPELAASQVSDTLPTSNVIFRCDDLKATSEELTARDVEVPQASVHMPFGSLSMFNDSEESRFALRTVAPGHP
jgi:hypothetical protein